MDFPQPGTHLPPPHEALWHLLYRYLWPFQYFSDVTRGSLMERQQNYRHNRTLRHCLPGFAFKWLCLTLVWFALGWMCHSALQLVLLAAGCFFGGCVALIVMLNILVAWSWLSRFPERY
jgi:hypothetical protein